MQSQQQRQRPQPSVRQRIGLVLLAILLPMLVASSRQAGVAAAYTWQITSPLLTSLDQIPDFSKPPPIKSLLDDPIYQNALLRLQGTDRLGKDGPLQKLSFDLIYLSAEFQAYRTQRSATAFQSTLPLLPIDNTVAGPLITIDAIASHDGIALLGDLQALGLRNGQRFGVVVSGQFPVNLLERLATLTTLRFAEPVLATTQAGPVTNQADRAMETGPARATYGLSGQGITIGVASDSYDCLQGAQADIAAGELPPDSIILAESEECKTKRDEGRAMMQVMADIAPGARFAFHTAFSGRAAFANAILKLADVAGVKVIVDDILYYNEPMFQDGIVAQAVDQVVAQGVAYFSSAGNVARQSYESPYVKAPSLLGLGELHDFDPGPGTDTLQNVTIPVGTTAVFSLQWDQPYASTAGGAGAANDLDLLLVGPLGTPLAVGMNNNIGRDPVEVLRYTNPGPRTQFDLAISHARGPAPTLMKYVYFGQGVTVNEYLTGGSTVFGQASAKGAIAVGAAFYGDTPAFGITPPQVQPFSSAGPTLLLFDQADQPIREIRAKPELIAPDGVNTSFFGRDITDPDDGSDQDSFPNFFGTSAAAPNAAAVAALLLEADPTLSPAQLYTLLTSTALRMAAVGADEQTGFGLLQADQALAQRFQHDMVSQSTPEPITALPGQPVTYTLAFIQNGPQPAHSLVITNTLPAQLQNVTVGTAAFGPHAALTTLMTPGAYIWKIKNFNLEKAGGVLTINGIVDPFLSVDSSLTNRVRVSSLGDTTLVNNVSQATITVLVPRVQFGNPAYNIAPDGSYRFNLHLDRINPYADTAVTYTLVKQVNPAYQSQLLNGLIVFERGQMTTTLQLSAPADAQADNNLQLSLSQPRAAQLGFPAAVTILRTSSDEELPDPSDKDDDGIIDVNDPDVAINRLYLPLIQAPE